MKFRCILQKGDIKVCITNSDGSLPLQSNIISAQVYTNLVIRLNKAVAVWLHKSIAAANV